METQPSVLGDGCRSAQKGVVRMCFKVLGLVIAVALFVKAIIALAVPRRFYAVRRRHYASDSVPHKLLVAPVLVIALTLAAWYAAFFHYRPWGWVVTGFLTLLACMAVDHVLRWQRHREAMLKVLTSSKVWQIDCLLMALGVVLAALALLVY